MPRLSGYELAASMAGVPRADSKVADDAVVQLGVRIPRALHRRVRVHCAEAERQMHDFVAEAIAEKLKREASRQPR